MGGEEEFTEEDFEVFVELPPPSQRWHWSFAAIHALSFAGSVAHAAGTFFLNVARDTASHANYQVDQDERKRFAADADQEIEQLLKEN